MRTKFWLLFAALLISSTSAFALEGGNGSGGGDTCEDRIKIVRDDLGVWIRHGGSADLQLPTGLNAKAYDKRILAQLKIAKIRCVGPGDNGFPVEIAQTAKVCKFDLSAHLSQITCDFDKFNSISESYQYVLIHHEFAGLAKIESPQGDSSTYSVSNQISAYLENVVVKKLVVKHVSDGDSAELNRVMHVLSKTDPDDRVTAFVGWEDLGYWLFLSYKHDYGIDLRDEGAYNMRALGEMAGVCVNAAKYKDEWHYTPRCIASWLSVARHKPH